jgi:hypothetical protein
MDVIQTFLNRPSLHEVSSSITKISKAEKRRRLGGSVAMRLAKQRRDPAYQKYMKFRKLALSNKKKLQQRYGRKGLSTARRDYW